MLFLYSVLLLIPHLLALALCHDCLELFNHSTYSYGNHGQESSMYSEQHLHIIGSIQESVLVLKNGTCQLDIPYSWMINSGLLLKVVMTRKESISSLCSSLSYLYPNVDFLPCASVIKNVNTISLKNGFWVDMESNPVFIAFSISSGVVNETSASVYKNGTITTLQGSCFTYSDIHDDAHYVNVTVKRNGFHSQLHIEGVLEDSASSLTVVFPNGIYVSKDELNDLVENKIIPSFETYPQFVDIEAVSSNAYPFLLVISFPPSHVVSITIPIHMRYSFASSRYQFVTYSIESIAVFESCKHVFNTNQNDI